MLKIFKFKTRGNGVITTELIKKDEYIGTYLENPTTSFKVVRHIYDGWFETPLLGRYINHNIESNCNLIKTDNSIKLISKCDILENQEITINYFDVIDLLKIPSDIVLKHGIYNFSYIEENVMVNDKLI